MEKMNIWEGSKMHLLCVCILCMHIYHMSTQSYVWQWLYSVQDSSYIQDGSFYLIYTNLKTPSHIFSVSWVILAPVILIINIGFHTVSGVTFLVHTTSSGMSRCLHHLPPKAVSFAYVHLCPLLIHLSQTTTLVPKVIV